MKKLLFLIITLFVVISSYAQYDGNLFSVPNSTTMFYKNLPGQRTIIFDQSTNKLWKLNYTATGNMTLATANVTELTNSVEGTGFLGTWNAYTNIPALASGVGDYNTFYIVDSAGSTALDTVTTWAYGDYVYFNGTAWVKIYATYTGYLYQGTWNSSTNVPVLTSGACTDGHMYVVSVAGTTTLDGISSWSVGDQVYCDGSTWKKIDNNSITSGVEYILPSPYALKGFDERLHTGGSYLYNFIQPNDERELAVTISDATDRLYIYGLGVPYIGWEHYIYNVPNSTGNIIVAEFDWSVPTWDTMFVLAPGEWSEVKYLLSTNGWSYDFQRISNVIDTSSIVHFSDTNTTIATQYDLSNGLAGKADTNSFTLHQSDTTSLLATQYDLSSESAGKADTNSFTLHQSDTTSLLATQYDLSSESAGKADTNSFTLHQSDSTVLYVTPSQLDSVSTIITVDSSRRTVVRTITGVDYLYYGLSSLDSAVFNIKNTLSGVYAVDVFSDSVTITQNACLDGVYMNLHNVQTVSTSTVTPFVIESTFTKGVRIAGAGKLLANYSCIKDSSIAGSIPVDIEIEEAISTARFHTIAFNISGSSVSRLNLRAKYLGNLGTGNALRLQYINSTYGVMINVDNMLSSGAEALYISGGTGLQNVTVNTNYLSGLTNGLYYGGTYNLSTVLNLGYCNAPIIRVLAPLNSYTGYVNATGNFNGGTFFANGGSALNIFGTLQGTIKFDGGGSGGKGNTGGVINVNSVLQNNASITSSAVGVGGITVKLNGDFSGTNAWNFLGVNDPLVKFVVNGTTKEGHWEVDNENIIFTSNSMLQRNYIAATTEFSRIYQTGGSVTFGGTADIALHYPIIWSKGGTFTLEATAKVKNTEPEGINGTTTYGKYRMYPSCIRKDAGNMIINGGVLVCVNDTAAGLEYHNFADTTFNQSDHQTNKQFRSVAELIGTVSLGSGLDFSATADSFSISVNGGSTYLITLNKDCQGATPSGIDSIVSYLNERLADSSITNAYFYTAHVDASNYYLGLRADSVSNDTNTFTISTTSGTFATRTGLVMNTYGSNRNAAIPTGGQEIYNQLIRIKQD